MKTLGRTLALSMLLAVGPVQGVSLSLDPSGQVLIFPFYVVGGGFQTMVEIRNTDSTMGRALRVVLKDPINGRPNTALNVYLGPDDGWSAALYDPDGANSVEGAGAAFARWGDGSCTLPALADLPASGLRLGDRFHGEDLSSIVTSNRLSSGFIEVYEMGTLDPALAVDCQSLADRWSTGVWSGDTNQARNDGVGVPSGGIEGQVAVINTFFGSSFHFEPLVLDGFRNQPLHTHPDHPQQPSLADVLPAESRILETVEFANRTIQVERVSTWSEDPVNAVDALLMTPSVRSDFSSKLDVGAIASVLLTLPTRAYHTDAEGFYGAQSALAPFKVQVPTPPGQSLAENRFQARARDRDGLEVDLTTNPGATDCDLLNGSVTAVYLINQFGFDYTCEFVRSEFRVHSTVVEGEIGFDFEGSIVSDEGHEYLGLPVIGVLLQTIDGRFFDPTSNTGGVATYGWARIMKNDRLIIDPD